MRVQRSPRPPAVFASHTVRAGSGARVAVTLVVLVVLVGATALVAGRLQPDGSLAGLADRVTHGQLGRQDGFVPAGASVSPWSTTPAVARLTPDLRRALHAATADARAAGVVLRVNSGWRSARYQRQLFRRAVRTYDDAAVARRYVLPPERSAHVRGRAVDVGPTDAAVWLEQHGAAYGLCRTYANELWHFELATVPGGTCPAARADATG